MTNTRLTDPEVMETRYPVVLREFSIRKGSEGAGKHHGGAGIVREVEFLKPLTVSLLTNRRKHGPYGICGGDNGEPGINQLIRVDHAKDGDESSREILPPSCEFTVEAGDRLRIETPGGGGWGEQVK